MYKIIQCAKKRPISQDYINKHAHDAAISPFYAFVGRFCHFDYKTIHFIE